MGALSGPPAGILTVTDQFQHPPRPEVVSCGLPPRFTMPTASRAQKLTLTIMAIVSAAAMMIGVAIAPPGTPQDVLAALYPMALILLLAPAALL